MKLGKRQLGAASCMLAPSDALPANMRAVIEVSSVHTDEWHRRKGIANRLMDMICEEADKEKTVLILMPDGEPWLQQWYRSHGFVTLQPEPLIMARPPYHAELSATATKRRDGAVESQTTNDQRRQADEAKRYCC